MGVLYHEQLERGAGLVDVGIWKSFFDRSVMDSIGNLVKEGRIQVRSSGQLIGRNDMAASVRRKRRRHRNGNAASGWSSLVTASQHHHQHRIARSPEGTRRELVEGVWAETIDRGVHSQEMLGPIEDGHIATSTSSEATINPSSLAGRIFSVVAKVTQRGLSGVNWRRGPAKGPGGR